MFSTMFMMNMLLKMIIYAKVCIIFFETAGNCDTFKTAGIFWYRFGLKI